MEIARDRRLAERRQPGRGGMDRKAAKGDPVRRPDDHHPARRLGAARPRTERGRRDRAGIDDAGVRRDDDLRRHAAVGPGPLAHVGDQRAQGFRLGRIEHPRDLRGMDLRFVSMATPALPLLCCES